MAEPVKEAFLRAAQSAKEKASKVIDPTKETLIKMGAPVTNAISSEANVEAGTNASAADKEKISDWVIAVLIVVLALMGIMWGCLTWMVVYNSASTGKDKMDVFYGVDVVPIEKAHLLDEKCYFIMDAQHFVYSHPWRLYDKDHAQFYRNFDRHVANRAAFYKVEPQLIMIIIYIAAFIGFSIQFFVEISHPFAITLTLVFNLYCFGLFFLLLCKFVSFVLYLIFLYNSHCLALF